jgi:hypothetical protein
MKQNKKPFFAAFLEKQVREPNKINGGQSIVTKPLFDSPTSPTKDREYTMKYPSDGDDDIY